ncbi:hypothetical protein [Paenibacillus sp. TSA_86.1]|uniref:hypothetical protein n=1 Tax=Paenibacillus sp. TSA_86.1 TaxID=3415649 RepID=UPI004045F934
MFVVTLAIMENDRIKSPVQKQFSHNAEHYVPSVIHAQGEDLALLVENRMDRKRVSFTKKIDFDDWCQACVPLWIGSF